MRLFQGQPSVRFTHFVHVKTSKRLCLLGQHTARGATKEKASKLDELKAKRKAKDDKKRVCAIP